MRIAHLSDVHMLDPRRGEQGARYRLATGFVNLGQSRIAPRDARARRFARALRAARSHGAEHIVISGDLTDVGADSEFERLAELLSDAGLPEDSVTLVPGNHDIYTRGDAWSRAMRGPLARFARTSAALAGKVVERGAIALLPVDTTRFQTLAWSGGLFTSEAARAIDRRASDPAFRDKALVLVMHHPPFHPVRAMKWIDGLRGGANVLELLARHPRLALLHGHLHRIFNHLLATPRAVGAALRRAPVLRKAEVGGAEARVFGAPATCEGPDDDGVDLRGFRLYDVVSGGLVARDGTLPVVL